MRSIIGVVIRAVAVGMGLVLVPVAAGLFASPSALISLSETGTSSQISSGNPVADSKMMMPNPVDYQYIAGPDLSNESGSGHVFELQLQGDSHDILQTISNVMHISGTIFEPEYSSAEYPVFQIGSQDGTGPSATINWTGTGNWWFSNPAAYPSAECSAWDKAEDGTKFCSSYAEQIATPDLLPSKDQMVATAVKIFSATGLRVTPSDIHTSRNDWAASAYASLQIGGLDSPVEWSINWGSNGQLGSVSGHSVKAIDRGEFKTISAKSAVSRMSDWRFSGQLPQSIWEKYQTNEGSDAIAYDEPVNPLGSEAETATPKPEIVTVTVTKSITSQLIIWDKQGSPWIVPGHILFSSQGWITPIFALEDGVVELPSPVEISPMVK